MSANPARWSGDRVLGGLALACIALQFPGNLELSALALVAWLGATAHLDRAALRRMWMPRFWGITVVLALGTGIALGRKDLDLWGIPLSTEGLGAGALMVCRGALIFGLTTWAGPALLGRRLPRMLGHVGLAPLGGAASVAIGLLPGLQVRLSAARRVQETESTGATGRVGRLHRFAVSAFCETVRLAEEIAAAGTRPRAVRVAALVGAVGEGKTTRVLEIVRCLRDAGLRIGGVVQVAVQTDGVRTGYDLMDVATGERRRFACRTAHPTPGGPRFAFDDAGWSWAADRIREAKRTADVVVVDEIGRLEAEGGGHLKALMESRDGEQARWWLLSVRTDGAAAVEQWVGGFDVREDIGASREGTTRGLGDLVSRLLDEDSRQPGADLE